MAFRVKWFLICVTDAQFVGASPSNIVKALQLGYVIRNQVVVIVGMFSLNPQGGLPLRHLKKSRSVEKSTPHIVS